MMVLESAEEISQALAQSMREDGGRLLGSLSHALLHQIRCPLRRFTETEPGRMLKQPAYLPRSLRLFVLSGVSRCMSEPDGAGMRTIIEFLRCCKSASAACYASALSANAHSSLIPSPI